MLVTALHRVLRAYYVLSILPTCNACVIVSFFQMRELSEAPGKGVLHPCLISMIHHSFIHFDLVPAGYQALSL